MRIAALLLWVGLASAAGADWMFLGSIGQKPNRVGLFADISSIGSANEGLQA